MKGLTIYIDMTAPIEKSRIRFYQNTNAAPYLAHYGAVGPGNLSVPNMYCVKRSTSSGS